MEDSFLKEGENIPYGSDLGQKSERKGQKAESVSDKAYAEKLFFICWQDILRKH